MSTKTNVRIVVSAVVGIFILLLAVGSFYTVDEGERGVVVRYGSVVAVSEPGLHFKIPLVDAVRRISTQEQVEMYQRMEAYSNDQQPALMNISVRYQIDSSRVDDTLFPYTTLFR